MIRKTKPRRNKHTESEAVTVKGLKLRCDDLFVSCGGRGRTIMIIQQKQYSDKMEHSIRDCALKKLVKDFTGTYMKQ